MSGKWLTPEEDAQVASLYASGLSQSQVAQKIGRTRNAVFRSLTRQGIAIRGLTEGHWLWRAQQGHKKGSRPKRQQPKASSWRSLSIGRVSSVFQLGA